MIQKKNDKFVHIKNWKHFTNKRYNKQSLKWPIDQEEKHAQYVSQIICEHPI